VFSIGVFGAILIVVMLFFPRGLLPGLQELGRRARRPHPSASAASESSA
jgi:hypothetical protein